jgi:hypothetical protein
MTTPFEPAKHLTQLSGKDYLEVKWRLVWFRSAAPLGSIETECLYHDHERALFKATARMNTVQLSDGSLVKDVPCVATGHGSETVKDFRDYIEKAETKAIGRALAALGFGTQFAPDIDDGGSVGRVVDSPVERAQQRRPRQVTAAATSTGATMTAAPSNGDGDAQRATPAQPEQVGAIQSLWQRLNRPPAKLGPFLFEQFAQNDPAALTQEQAGTIIGQLDKELRLERLAQTA